MVSSHSTSLRSFGDLFDASLSTYRKHFKSIAILSAIAFASALPQLFLQPKDQTVSLLAIAAAVGYGIVSVLITTTMYYLIDEHQADKQLGRLLKLSLDKFLPIVLTSILATLAIAGGLLLLIIPGIIFAVWFVFVQPIVMFEDKLGVAALKQSRNYVRGHWWGIVGRLLLLALIMLAVTFILSITTFIVSLGNPLAAQVLNNMISLFVLAPVSTIFSYYLYRSAVEAYAQRSEPAPIQGN